MVDINYVAALMEEVRDQNKAILEGQEMDRPNIKKIPSIDNRLEKVERDVSAIKSAVKDTNKQVHVHETRITKLESAVRV